MDLFKLVGTIMIEGVDKAKSDLDGVSNTGQKTQGKLSKAFSTVGKGAVAVGKTVATGLAVGGAAMGALTVKALNLSGELEQNMGGSEAVFGKYATKMQDTAKSAFSQMGLSTSDFLATANKMGSLFQGAGFSVEESMDLSSSAMQRAADVASIMGIDTSAAMEAIAGAAKGNFTMMDNLGVAMNDTAIQNYALEKGIKKSTAEMTQQEKIGLAMEMFMEKTAYAAGNYAKENETLAGALGTAKSALTNFLDGSGSVDDLVSSFSNLANVAINSLTEIAPRLATGITQIINQVMPMLPPLIQALLPAIIDGAVSLINGLVAAFPAIISALMSALPALIAGVQNIINALIQALPQIMEALVAAFPTLVPLLVDALVSMIVTLATMLPELIQPIIDNLPMIIGTIVTALLTALPQLVVAGGQLLLGLLKGMLSFIGEIPETLSQIWKAIVGGIKNLFGIHSPSTVMMQIGTFIMQGLINGVKSLLNVFSSIWNTIKQTTVNVFNGIKSFVTTAINNVKSTISNGLNAAKSTVSNVLESIKNKFSSIWDSATNIVKGAIDKIKSFFNFEWSLPKIKLPHFKISGKFSLNPPSIPKFSVDWYKKAMDNPMLLTSPTIFGYNASTGQYMGGGEAGAEVVSGADTLMNMIQTSVATQNNVLADILYKILEAILAMDENMGGNLAEAMAGMGWKVNDREFARLVRKAVT